MNIRKRTWQILEIAETGDRLSRAVDWFILGLIFLNVVAVILGSVSSIQENWAAELHLFEIVSVVVFTLEYLGRLWGCVEAKGSGSGLKTRLRHIFRPMTVVDLLAILPFFLPFVGADLRSLRALRMLRILRMAKVARYYDSLDLIRQVFRSRKEELILTTSLMGMLLIVSATLLFSCENAAQPDVFSSIPATMWWSIATLTTVGYGDIYPITAVGRVFASVIAILGIGMFALPTGILGAGFVEEIQKKKQGKCCPHCGKEIG